MGLGVSLIPGDIIHLTLHSGLSFSFHVIPAVLGVVGGIILGFIVLPPQPAAGTVKSVKLSPKMKPETLPPSPEKIAKKQPSKKLPKKPQQSLPQEESVPQEPLADAAPQESLPQEEAAPPSPPADAVSQESPPPADAIPQTKSKAKPKAKSKAKPKTKSKSAKKRTSKKK